MGNNKSTSPPDGKIKEYLLGRGGQEYIRLASQHWLFKSRQGWLLHPTITQAIQHLPKPRIAEIATGTALWSAELAVEMPHAEITALDISDSQFPPEFALPPNVKLGLYDVLKEVPIEFQGVFDVVHVRLLTAAGPDVDKNVFFNRFRTLLRPGGWLQWEEVSAKPLSIEATADGIRETPMSDDHPMVQVRSKYLAMHRRCDWIHDFTRTAAQAGGFQHLQQISIPVRPHVLPIESMLVYTVLISLIDMYVSRKKDEERPEVLEEMRHAVDRIREDQSTGAMLAYSWNVCLAQKAGNVVLKARL